MAWRYAHKDVVPLTAMIAVECSNVGTNILFKAATSQGLSYYVFIVYSYAIATIVLLPLCFIFSRASFIQLSVLFKVFLRGLIGFLANLCGYEGLDYSSPTLTSTMSNLIPAFTCVLAVIFRPLITRMERVSLRSSSTQAKIMGTLVSISGAMVVVLYKEPTILSSPSLSFQYSLGTSGKNWVKGGLLLTVECFLFSTWYILQGFFGHTAPSFTHGACT